MTDPRKLTRRSLLAGGLGLAAAYAVGCGDHDSRTESTPSPSPTRTPSATTPTTAPTATAVPATPTPPAGIRARWGQLPAVGVLPPGRRDPTVVSDGTSLYLFGGRDPNPLGDAWTCDLASGVWTQTANGPEARFGHNAVWDAPRSRVVVFGGQGASFFQDTWEYIPGTGAWNQLDAGSGPSPRYGSASALDPSGRMLVSHGFTNSGRFDDTWGWSLGTSAWGDNSPAANRPLARCLTRGAWDSVNGRLLMFGGQSNPTPFLGDFWGLTPTGWTELPGGPPPRNLYAMAFDDAAERLILFGGAGEQDNLNDIWVFDIPTNAWTQVTPEGQAPSLRASHDAVWLPARNALIAFGGFNGTYLNDLWQLEFL